MEPQPTKRKAGKRESGNKTGNFARESHELREWKKCGFRILAALREYDLLQHTETREWGKLRAKIKKPAFPFLRNGRGCKDWVA
jgi:hypothetical protein